MQADMNEILHLKMEGWLTELLVRINLSYIGNSYVWKMELYGTLQAMLLSWKILTARLITWVQIPDVNY